MRSVTPFDARAYYYYYGGGALARRASGSLGGAFSPLSLGPSGLWLPFPAFLSEDEDGTGSVEHSDAVGRMMDQSGNDDHLLQATAGARPVYETSGGKHWLRSVSTDSMAATRTLNQPWERVSAWRILTLAGPTGLASGGADNFGTLYVAAGATNLRIYSGAEVATLPVPAQDVDFVVTERHNGASSRLAVDDGAYLDGDAGANASSALTLFAFGDGTNHIVARCYGIFERAGMPLLTDAEITNLRTYFSGLCEDPPL